MGWTEALARQYRQDRGPAPFAPLSARAEAEFRVYERYETLLQQGLFETLTGHHPTILENQDIAMMAERLSYIHGRFVQEGLENGVKQSETRLEQMTLTYLTPSQQTQETMAHKLATDHTIPLDTARQAASFLTQHAEQFWKTDSPLLTALILDLAAYHQDRMETLHTQRLVLPSPEEAQKRLFLAYQCAQECRELLVDKKGFCDKKTQAYIQDSVAQDTKALEAKITQALLIPQENLQKSPSKGFRM